jgi:AcrR family transcriptional regulator
VFNEHGTAAVSLNSLAEALGISTGNLQYHYRSKEEIIRAILEVMFKDWNTFYQEMDTKSFTMDTLRRILRINFDLVWKYRFFYRELNALLRNDAILAKRYAVIQEGRLAEQEMLTKQMATSRGRSISGRELRNMVLVGWVLSNSWLSYVESTGRPVDERAMEDAVEILVQFYKPYVEKIT